MSANGPAGFFGKIPSHGDFVRGNVGDPLVQRLVAWLEEAGEACIRSKAQLAREPIRFLFRAGGESRALVGVLRGSQDRVGRQFPVAVFLLASGPAVEAEFPSAPIVHRRFLDAACAAIAEDPASASVLAEKVAALPAPGPEDVKAGGEEARAHASRASEELLRLFGEAAGGGRHYAVNTFLSACAAVRAREPARAETLLDCPAAGAADVWAWLELARLALGWRAPPPFFVRAAAGRGRLLVSLGAPPAAALPALCEPPRDNPKIWPLETRSSPAIDAARKALGAARCAALDGGRATLAELAKQLVGGR